MTLLLAGNGRMAIRALGNGTYRKRRIRGHKGHAGKFSGWPISLPIWFWGLIFII